MSVLVPLFWVTWTITTACSVIYDYRYVIEQWITSGRQK